MKVERTCAPDPSFPRKASVISACGAVKSARGFSRTKRACKAVSKARSDRSRRSDDSTWIRVCFSSMNAALSFVGRSVWTMF